MRRIMRKCNCKFCQADREKNRLVPVQVTLPTDLKKRAQNEAKKQGISFSEYVRRAVDALILELKLSGELDKLKQVRKNKTNKSVTSKFKNVQKKKKKK